MSDSDALKDGRLPDTLISEPCPTLEIIPDFGDGGRVKVCEGCDEGVHNLSALSQAEAVELLDQNDGICIRFDVGANGKPRLRIPPTGLKPALVGGVTMALAMVAGCGEQSLLGGGESEDAIPESTTQPVQETEGVKGSKIDQTQHPAVGRVAPKGRATSSKVKAAEGNEADCEDEPTPL